MLPHNALPEAYLTPDGFFITGPVEVLPFGPEVKCFKQRTHAHAYDHYLACVEGGLSIDLAATEGGEPLERVIVDEGQMFLVKEGVWHTVKDRVGGSVYVCIRRNGAAEGHG